MSLHGARYLNEQAFVIHCKDLKVASYDAGAPSAVTLAELEFYETCGLLAPSVIVRAPLDRELAQVVEAQWDGGGGVDQAMLGPAADAVHPFDRERDANAFLVTPRHAAYEAWAGPRFSAYIVNDLPPRVERYYAPWQAHVVNVLRLHRCYDPILDLFRRNSPLDIFVNSIAHTVEEQRRRATNAANALRFLQLITPGLDALERFCFAEATAFRADPGSRYRGPYWGLSSEERRDRYLRVMAAGRLDEAGLFSLISHLGEMVFRYRDGERTMLAADAERYLWDAEALAHEVFGYDREAFLAATERHGGEYARRTMGTLDPIDHTQRIMAWALTSMLTDLTHPAWSEPYRPTADMPLALAQFCWNRGLLRVLDAVAGEGRSVTERPQRGLFPGKRLSQLRDIAFAGEELARGIIETVPQVALAPGDGYSKMIEVLVADDAWKPLYRCIREEARPNNHDGALPQRAADLAKRARSTRPGDLRAVAKLLVAAEATRNLTAHHLRGVLPETLLVLEEACVVALLVIWVAAKKQGWV